MSTCPGHPNLHPSLTQVTYFPLVWCSVTIMLLVRHLFDAIHDSTSNACFSGIDTGHLTFWVMGLFFVVGMMAFVTSLGNRCDGTWFMVCYVYHFIWMLGYIIGGAIIACGSLITKKTEGNGRARSKAYARGIIAEHADFDPYGL